MIIKKYKNRKLYDCQNSCYVNLEEIESIIKSNQQVKVIDNITGEDITGQTLLQLIANNPKNYSNLNMIYDIINNNLLQ